VNFAEQKTVVNGFTACDFAIKVCIDIRVCRFLIGNAGGCETDCAASD
jgi:hypothetical protein